MVVLLSLKVERYRDSKIRSSHLNVKQLNGMETNITNYVTGEFGKVNPVLSNNSDLIKFIYRNLIRNDSKLLLIKELHFPDSVEGRTQNNYTYQTNGDNKGDVTFYLTFVHKAIRRSRSPAAIDYSMTIHLEWEDGIHPIYIFVSSSKLVLLYIRLTMKNLIGREHSINSQ